jgi:hypothetical protein
MTTRKIKSLKKDTTRKSGTIGPLRKGELSKHGYSSVMKLTKPQRHTALKKAIEEYGSLTVWRKINAVHVYTRYSSPRVSSIFKDVMDWIRKYYGLKAE